MTRQEVLKAFHGLNNRATVMFESTQLEGKINGEITAVCCHEEDSDYFSIKILGDGGVLKKILVTDVFFLEKTN